MRRFLFVVLLLAASVPFSAGQQNDPVADPKAVVTAGAARFTVLTPHLIRMEWAADRKFEDRASMVFLNRRLPVPKFQTSDSGGWLTIATDDVTVRYKKDAKFAPETLTVEFAMPDGRHKWIPGMPDKGNLLGTYRTLDGARGSHNPDGPIPLEPGLISRDGWVLVDDSSRPLFDNSDWAWVTARPAGERQDWYLFAYGHDYKSALLDFTRVAGKIPLPSYFAFGTWWSRYWAYTDQELRELVSEFHEHDVPLDVLVVDMDWHLTFANRWGEDKRDQSGHSLGWTGYTWNRNYFPDPPGFLRWAHEQGLKTTLNLHPASGVQPHEEQYTEMARAMGIDPATEKYVPFDIANKKFAENYFKILHHPMERQGVDFWWLDWQQEDKTNLPGVNPTWWLNYAHFTDMERRGKRGLLFHRWGGLGNHRYQIGFSGDTISVWESLAYQPYFTATAANVGYGYWSHDIGGHMPGEVDPELYTRWIQFGVFSPILRTHTTKNPKAERRIWAYPAEYAETMRDAYQLRYALIPYIYTMGRRAYDTGLSLCLPLYYDDPEAPEAYQYNGEYRFGRDMIVAPVTEAMDPGTRLVSKDIWLPQGTWIEYSTGAKLKGPGVFHRTFALDEFPVYVREGAVIPMAPKVAHTDTKQLEQILLTVWAGGNGKGELYEDETNTLGYKKDEFAVTRFTNERVDETTTRITIQAADGRFPGMLQQRRYEVRLRGDWPVESAELNGQAIAASDITYDGASFSAVIDLPLMATDKTQVLTIHRGADTAGKSGLLNAAAGKIHRLHQAMSMLNSSWPGDWSPEELVAATLMGERVADHPETAVRELESLDSVVAIVVQRANQLHSSPGLVDNALAHLQGPFAMKLTRQAEVH